MIPDDLTVEKVVELIGPETIIPVLECTYARRHKQYIEEKNTEP